MNTTPIISSRLPLLAVLMAVFCSLAPLAAQRLVNIEEQDSSFMIPEQLLANVDSLLQQWKEQYQLADDYLCYESPDVASLPDSVYVERLASLPHILDMTYNPLVKRSIDFYLRRGRNAMSYLLGQQTHYFPMMEEVFYNEGLPIELKYLAIVESSLRPTAVSHANAVGLWQFVYGTARYYQLDINSRVDERRDVHKATIAAARCLRDLYTTYGDWYLAMAAYNCGPGNVNRAILRSGGKRTFWELYPYLPYETRNYVPMFIGCCYAMNFYREHNICPLPVHIPEATDSITVHDNINMKRMAELIDMPLADIRQLNPQFTTDYIPGNKPYTIYLPAQEASRFAAMEDSIVAQTRTERPVSVKVGLGGGVYRVRSGDTLSGIAKRYRTSVTAIKRINGLRSNFLRIGQRLRIPG